METNNIAVKEEERERESESQRVMGSVNLPPS
jgi:hypothetical protein